MKKLSLFLSLYFTISSFTYCQGYIRAENKYIVNNNGPVILRGMGLGGWMLQEPYMLQLSGIAGTQHEIRAKIADLIGEEKTTAFYNSWLKNGVTKADIDALASWGFNSIRLPMHYNLFTLPVEQEPVAGKDTWLDKGFSMVDKLLSWCEADHIYLILDLHAAPGGQGNDVAISDRKANLPSLWESEANKQKTINLWVKLASRYANKKWIGGYDLINETNWGFENAADKNGCAETQNVPLRNLLQNITTAIRKVDNNHIIFIEANCWANNYKGVFPLWDKNIVVSFHKYWNYNDQGSVNGFIKIRDDNDVPVWIGESGENSNAWYTDAISLMERNNIGWAWWPLKKIGINNPLEVRPDTEYAHLINYWRGKEEKPGADLAYKCLMQLANNWNFKNNIIHKDVVDAMFRQVHTSELLPFADNKITGNKVIFAVNYDMGRSGVAYHDADSANYRSSTNKNSSWNKGHLYRNDGVDIDACTDSITNGYKIFSIEDGEWLNYTVNVLQAGNYKVIFRYRATDEASIKLEINNGALVKDIKLPSSQGWRSAMIDNLSLKKGKNRIRLVFETNGPEFNYMQFIKR